MNFYHKSEVQENRWKILCNLFLPIESNDTIWRQNRLTSSEEPEQGWKLHISATILSACDVFEKVAPFLSKLDILFKATRSLYELKKLNCGLYYGYSQIGKFITVYPRTVEEALFIARELQRLTIMYPCPLIPSDIPFTEGSCIHYRYGAFKNLAIKNSDGESISAVRTPDGELVPDLRELGKAVPSWITNPFIRKMHYSKPKVTQNVIGQLKTTFLTYEAISQRGKSGVYRCLDLSVKPARLCILKEGRRHGETDWDNRDGYWRVLHEAEVLAQLNLAGINVPKVYATFEEGRNYYLAMEAVEGKNLQQILQKKIPIRDAIQYGLQLCKILYNIHSFGWVWRDCKPINLIVDNKGILRPIDFEGACSIDSPDHTHWGTLGYVPPEWNLPFKGQSRLPEDLYALGATLHQLFSGQIPTTSPLVPIEKLRRRVPSPVRKVISDLLSQDPASRPNALFVSRILEMSFLEEE